MCLVHKLHCDLFCLSLLDGKEVIVDCISDLHGFYPQLPGGDLLLIAGDLTANDTTAQYLEFREWLNSLDYPKKIFISGNHDMLMQEGSFYFNPEWFGAEWLNDSGTQFDGLKIWGSPWSLAFKGINPLCAAFTGTEGHLEEKFRLIPHDVDILVTHSPPWLVMDMTKDGHHAGSRSLHNWLFWSGRPRLHVFGHIHEAYGEGNFFDSTISVNCSHVDACYKSVNAPVRVVL